MEDEGFVDDDFIEETAWDYFSRHGAAGAALLRKLAKAAEAAGDEFAAQTWHAAADVAERIVNRGGRRGFAGSPE